VGHDDPALDWELAPSRPPVSAAGAAGAGRPAASRPPNRSFSRPVALPSPAPPGAFASRRKIAF